MKYQAVIFDLDGTLLDTLGDLTAAVNHVMEQHGYPLSDIPQVRAHIGNGLRRLIALSVPEGTSEDMISACHAEMVSYYKEHLIVHTHPYTGITAALEQLHTAGVKLALLSNKFHVGSLELAEHFFPGCFDLVLGEREGVPRKPDPTSTLEILERLGLTREQVAYVGDSAVDMQTAKNAGLFSVGVTWGFRSRQDLEENGACVLAEHPADLPGILLDERLQLDRVEKAFRHNRFAFSYFADAASAAAYLTEQCSGHSCAFGGSKTLEAMGLYDCLSGKSDLHWHWHGDAICDHGECYLTSANGLSAEGEVVNIDGNCNRIAGAMWGFKRAYIVCGLNKLTPDLASAIDRARNIAAPLNAKRLNRKTPCAADGVCHNCNSPERICKVMAVTMQPPAPFEHYEIILVGEKLGY